MAFNKSKISFKQDLLQAQNSEESLGYRWSPGDEDDHRSMTFDDDDVTTGFVFNFLQFLFFCSFYFFIVFIFL